jgi:integrase/recombinase XerD
MNKSQNAVNSGPGDIASKLFGDYPAQFRQDLVKQNYTERTIALYLHRIGLLAKMMEADGICIRNLDEAQAVAFVARTNWTKNRRTQSISIVRRFVRFLNAHGLGKPALPPTAKERARAELKVDYESYLRRQRGLSEYTVYQCWRFADRFMEFRFGQEVGNLSQITASDIVSFLQKLTTRKQPYRDKTPSVHLRNFFRYLFSVGKTVSNLSLCIPSVAQRYAARLPRHLTPAQVNALLNTIRSDKTRGRRNYAMALLLARLGLRAPEVTAIQLDDIDWRSGEIIVRGKGKRHDRVPLPPDVGKALADYIRFDRVTASRALFVTERAPHKPFKNGEVLNSILTDAFAKCGLKPPAPYVGSHVLRHSLAINLVRRGASMEEISDMLRHRSRAATMIYARMDIDNLRSIAPPWPISGGAK